MRNATASTFRCMHQACKTSRRQSRRMDPSPLTSSRFSEEVAPLWSINLTTRPRLVEPQPTAAEVCAVSQSMHTLVIGLATSSFCGLRIEPRAMQRKFLSNFNSFTQLLLFLLHNQLQFVTPLFHLCGFIGFRIFLSNTLSHHLMSHIMYFAV